MAGYKIPREIRVLDQLPRNPTGKIMRRALGPLIEADSLGAKGGRVAWSTRSVAHDEPLISQPAKSLGYTKC